MYIERKCNINKNNYFLKEIDPEYNEDVLRLFCDCNEFFVMTEGRVPKDCKEFFFDLPPNKELEDKYSFGIFSKKVLIGVIDIIKDYPEKGEWIIGLMLLHPNVRGSGLGRAVHDTLINIVRELKCEKLRIGVVEQNEDGLKFWERIGYEKIKVTEPIRFGIKESKVIVMNYYL